MPKNYYIKRDDKNAVIGLYSRPQYEGHEKLDESDQIVQDFKNSQKTEFDQDELIRKKVAENNRTKAISDLKTEGKLPADYSETAAVI